MKYLFFVQGEGRGHLTQALTLKKRLEDRGHSIAAIIVGGQAGHQLPAFFKEQINVPLFIVVSPHFSPDKEGRGINILSSILKSFALFPEYLKSIKKINKIVQEAAPDRFISFYEPLGSTYYRLYREKKPLFCLGHQYFINHPVCPFPKGQLFSRLGFRVYNYFNAPRRSHKIALSFTNETDQKDLHICPPLIRQSIKEKNPHPEGFLLIYMLNAGYSRDIINWSKNNPGFKIEAFWNKPEQEVTVISPDLTFHNLNGEKFMDRLARCSAYASTAGFESIAETAYLQKNIMVVPTKGHFEQECNSLDAERAGLAIASKNFDLSKISLAQQKTHSSPATLAFKEWVDSYDDKMINLLEK